MIEVHDLRVDYDDFCAVRDLTLSIGPGEVYGLIGPNGAGKTSTMRSLTGLVDPTYGEIRLNGIDLLEHREEAIQNLGFMPDFPPVYEDLTVWEFLDCFAASYLIPKPERAPVIDKYLALVDLTEKRNVLTAGLSRGMKQRLMLAKTLIPEPPILILDEPASGMDPHGRALLRDIVKSLAAEGKTVLISSHILTEMSEMCTSVGIMERGRMVVTGRVEEVAARVLGQAEMYLEVVRGEELLHQLLRGHPEIDSIRQDGDGVAFSFKGDADAASVLLAELIAAGVRISHFGRKRERLEEVFLKVGAKEVS